MGSTISQLFSVGRKASQLSPLPLLSNSLPMKALGISGSDNSKSGSTNPVTRAMGAQSETKKKTLLG